MLTYGRDHDRLVADNLVQRGAGKGYWLGYRTSVPGSGQERLYAVNSEGRKLCTTLLDMPNPDFDKPGRVWLRVDEVPEDAEYIGYYRIAKADE